MKNISSFARLLFVLNGQLICQVRFISHGREWNTFIFLGLIFVIIFWLCTWHYNLLFYLRPIWIYLQPPSFQKNEISRNKCHPVCNLFIQGFFPKMCTVTWWLKCTRPWHYHWITAVLQILLPTADLSLGKQYFGTISKKNGSREPFGMAVFASTFLVSASIRDVTGTGDTAVMPAWFTGRTPEL